MDKIIREERNKVCPFFKFFLQEEKSIDAVNKIDIMKYKDSMLPLIQKILMSL